MAERQLAGVLRHLRRMVGPRDGGDVLDGQLLGRFAAYTALSNRPLEEAVQELANSTGVNVVLDPRVGDKARAIVTARLMNVPVDRAVRLLADMADLKAVLLGNVLYVTSQENAAQWEKEAAKEKPTKVEGKKDEKLR